MFRIYGPGSSEDPHLTSHRLWGTDSVTASYRAGFNCYGVTEGGRKRIHCPEQTKPITPPPAQRTGLPDTYLDAFKTILGELPPTTTKDDVLGALRAKLPPVPVDEQTKLPWPSRASTPSSRTARSEPPASGGGSCLTGVRLADGTVAARYPPRVQTRPGEYGCSGRSALQLYEVPPPK